MRGDGFGVDEIDRTCIARKPHANLATAFPEVAPLRYLRGWIPEPKGAAIRDPYVRLDGAKYQWRQVPPRELSIDLVAGGRRGRATGPAEAA